MNERSAIDDFAEYQQAGNADPGARTAEFEWPDADGETWRIQATPHRLELTQVGGEERTHTFDRATWREKVTFSPIGTQVVLRFDLGDREVGFMVPVVDARALFVAMGQSQPEEAEKPRAETTARPVTPGEAIWPKMTTSAVVAMCMALLAFIPIVGIALGVGAIVLAVVARRRAPNNAAYAHVRTACRISLIVAQVGIVISVLATYTMFSAAPDRMDHVPFEDSQLKWGWGAGIAAVVMVLLALSIHEAAHAITAWWCGDGLAKSLGRVTLNPLAHIDPFGTVLLPILLISLGWPVFGYARPVPVRLDGVRRHHRAQILVAAAGPLSNLMQAAGFLALLTAVGSVLSLMPGVQVVHIADIEPHVEVTGVAGAPIIAGVVLMLKLGIFINIMLAFFNLIPIPPLDGSWIMQYLFPGTLGRFYTTIRPYGFFLFLGLIYLGGDLLLYLLLPGIYAMVACVTLLMIVTGFA